MTALTRLIDEALADERMRAAVPCQCLAGLTRELLDGRWACRCSLCGRTWYVTARPGD